MVFQQRLRSNKKLKLGKDQGELVSRSGNLLAASIVFPLAWPSKGDRLVQSIPVYPPLRKIEVGHAVSDLALVGTLSIVGDPADRIVTVRRDTNFESGGS